MAEQDQHFPPESTEEAKSRIVKEAMRKLADAGVDMDKTLLPPDEPNKPPPGSSLPMQYGWICPRCNRVNAPYVAICGCGGAWYPPPQPAWPFWPWYPPIIWEQGTGQNPNPFPTQVAKTTPNQSGQFRIVNGPEAH